MQYEEITWYSERLGRNMNIKIYGHYGQSILVFPTQNKMSDDFYNNGMIDALSNLIEEGRIKLFCIDSDDSTSISSSSWDNGERGYRLELYHQYIINEVIPFINHKQGGYSRPYSVGISSGALHAASVFFRRPELFNGFICLSGKYDVESFFGSYMDNNIYNYFPINFLRNMPWDHPYINIYNQKRMIMVAGQGAWEGPVVESNFQLVDACRNIGINIDFHLWDHNSVHDWISWRYTLPYFLNQIV